MGYTHYWEHQAIDQHTWDQVLFGVRAIARYVKTRHGLNLAGPSGRGKVQYEADVLAFNGFDDPNGEDDSYESFHIHRTGRPFDFCKTNHKPYDLAVCMVLIHFERRVPGFTVTSDGKRDGDEWMTALQNYLTLFPHHEERPA